MWHGVVTDRAWLKVPCGGSVLNLTRNLFLNLLSSGNKIKKKIKIKSRTNTRQFQSHTYKRDHFTGELAFTARTTTMPASMNCPPLVCRQCTAIRFTPGLSVAMAAGLMFVTK